MLKETLLFIGGRNISIRERGDAPRQRMVGRRGLQGRETAADRAQLLVTYIA
jgi:hypothetical protein